MRAGVTPSVAEQRAILRFSLWGDGVDSASAVPVPLSDAQCHQVLGFELFEGMVDGAGENAGPEVGPVELEDPLHLVARHRPAQQQPQNKESYEHGHLQQCLANVGYLYMCRAYHAHVAKSRMNIQS